MQHLTSFLSEDNDPAFDLLLQEATIVRFQPGQQVYNIGTVCDSFLILLAGSIRVHLSSSRGREVTLSRITPGDSCSVTISCLLNRNVYPADAVAESDSEAVAIADGAFHKALKHSQDFRRYILYGYSTSLANFIAKIEQLAFVPIDARLSNALLDFHERGEQRVTHQELADELGTAREVISRRLKHFVNEGWIRVARGRITVSDRNRLQTLCQSRYPD